MAEPISKSFEPIPALHPDLPQSLDSFKSAFLNLFKQLAFDHYADKPHADKVSNDARFLLITFITAFAECRTATDASVHSIQKVMDLGNSKSDPATALSLAEEIVGQHEEASHSLSEVKCFEGFKNRLRVNPKTH